MELNELKAKKISQFSHIQNKTLLDNAYLLLASEENRDNYKITASEFNNLYVEGFKNEINAYLQDVVEKIDQESGRNYSFVEQAKQKAYSYANALIDKLVADRVVPLETYTYDNVGALGASDADIRSYINNYICTTIDKNTDDIESLDEKAEQYKTALEKEIHDSDEATKNDLTGKLTTFENNVNTTLNDLSLTVNNNNANLNTKVNANYNEFTTAYALLAARDSQIEAKAENAKQTAYELYNTILGSDEFVGAIDTIKEVTAWFSTNDPDINGYTSYLSLVKQVKAATDMCAYITYDFIPTELDTRDAVIWNQITDISYSVIPEVQREIREAEIFLNSKIDTTYTNLNNDLNEKYVRLRDIIYNFNDNTTEQINTYVSYMEEQMSQSYDMLTSYIETTSYQLTYNLNTAYSQLNTYITDVQNTLTTNLNTAYTQLNSYITDTRKEFTTNLNTSYTQLNSYITDVQSTLSYDFNNTYKYITEEFVPNYTFDNIVSIDQDNETICFWASRS